MLRSELFSGLEVDNSGAPEGGLRAARECTLAAGRQCAPVLRSPAPALAWSVS